MMMTLPSTALPITTTAGILHLDHYKYLRSLLPQVPHVIQSLVFSDLHNWECQLFVNLFTESDSLKWLADFEEKTSTLWKADTDAARSLRAAEELSSRRSGGDSCLWLMIYRCCSEAKNRACTAKLEMKIFSPDGGGGTTDVNGGVTNNNKPGKYPCQVSISFFHNHVTSENTILTIDCLKSQDIPAHLKEGFEGYFHQETLLQQPLMVAATVLSDVMSAAASLTTTTATHGPVTAYKSQPAATNSLCSTLAHHTNPGTQMFIKEELDFVKAELPMSPVPTEHLDGKLISRLDPHTSSELCDLTEISLRLDLALETLRNMLKQSRSGYGAVKQFLDKFDKLKSDQNQLEDALTSFGGQWDWLVAPAEAPSTSQEVHQVSAGSALPSAEEAAATSSPIKTSNSNAKILKQQHQQQTLKRKKKDEQDGEYPSDNVPLLCGGGDNSANVLAVVQVSNPAGQQGGEQQGGSEVKKRKRARCGSCPGCLNRDKTQDCRTCRNCLDQKRYGGPGRLKKACVTRQCAILLAQSDSPKTDSSFSISSNGTSVNSNVLSISSSSNGVLSVVGSTNGVVTAHSSSNSVLPTSNGLITVVSGDEGGGVNSITNGIISSISEASIANSLASLLPVAIKSEPPSTAQLLASQTPVPVTLSTSQSIVLSEALSSVAASSANSGTTTLLSWPANQFAPTFQVQVQQPLQFTFQPQQLTAAPSTAAAFSSQNSSPATSDEGSQGEDSMQSLPFTTSQHLPPGVLECATTAQIHEAG